MADDDVNQEDRTEEASDRKREQVREQGQIPRSADFAGAFVLVIGILILQYFGKYIVDGLGEILVHFIKLTSSPPEVMSVADVSGYFLYAIYALFNSNWFYWVGVFLAAVVANLIMVGFYMSAEPLAPKLDRLNPIKGLQQKFSLTSLNLLIQNLGKFLVIVIVSYYVIKAWWLPSLTVSNKGYMNSISILLEGGFQVALYGAIVLLVWSLGDLVYQKWQHARSIRMTKEEVKKEMKDMLGDPILRQRRRQIQLNMARQRMLSKVPEADVIVTNPTFIAIAIKYDEKTMAAPIVLAKGMRLTAEKIRDIAKENNIAIVEKKELARELFKVCDAGEPVPENLYVAVAEILAFVYQIKRKKTK
jgi:flagellar biosynthetic protein FlhB